MNKQTLPLIGVLAVALAAGPAFADSDGQWDGDAYYAYARVVGADPIVRHVQVATPRQECWDQQVNVPMGGGYRSATPTVLGGIIGGVVGSTMGQGRGRDAAIIAGTVLGGSIGRDIGRQNAPAPAYTTETRTTCRVVNDYHDEARIEGYRVTYRYQGRDYVTHTVYKPGPRLRVRVDVNPAE